MTLSGPRVHWSTSCEYKYFTLSRSRTCARKKWSTLDVCLLYWVIGLCLRVSDIVRPSRRRHFARVSSELRSICSEKKTYFRNSRVALPPLSECRAVNEKLFTWTATRAAIPQLYSMVRESAYNSQRSSAHHRSTSCVIRCCIRSSSTEAR